METDSILMIDNTLREEHQILKGITEIMGIEMIYTIKNSMIMLENLLRLIVHLCGVQGVQKIGVFKNECLLLTGPEARTRETHKIHSTRDQQDKRYLQSIYL
jgi:hypothetical protein